MIIRNGILYFYYHKILNIMFTNKIIHQVWEGYSEKYIPIRLKILSQTWIENNPDWEYHLWTGKEMRELVISSFTEYENLYNSLPRDVQRWDIIRYMILYKYGGIYTDLDTECFKPINQLVNDISLGFGEEPPIEKLMPIRIGNAFLVSEKGNKGWIYIIENIKKNLDVSKSSIKSVMDSTGPNMINNIFPYIKKIFCAKSISYKLVTPVSKYDVNDFIYHNSIKKFNEKIKEAYCAHYFFGSWDKKISLY